MNIVLISYGDLDYDGRLRSLIDVFSKQGTLFVASRGTRPATKQSILINRSYPSFILKAILFASRIKKIDWLVIDNRKATIPGFFIRWFCKPRLIIQDCRELYLLAETKHLTGKIGCIAEKAMVKLADIIICANTQRAKIMKKEYHLEREPLSYENLRKLSYENEEEYNKAKTKIDSYLEDNEIRIVSTSGCSIARTNDVLVQNLDKVQTKCHLYLVGDSSINEIEKITSIGEGLKNKVSILGRLNQNELKYLISKCHIGIVNYGQYDTNNKFCASGKLYEFIYEGIPVVTTTNPPLLELCEKAKIGVADDVYYDGINEVISHYSFYRDSVAAFAQNNTIEKNDDQFIDDFQRAVKNVNQK